MQMSIRKHEMHASMFILILILYRIHFECINAYENIEM